MFLIFNYRAGAWYPFVPVARAGDGEQADEDAHRVERDVELERKLQAKLADTLPIVNSPDDWFQFREAPF